MKIGRGKGKLKIVGDAETSSIHKGKFAKSGGKKRSK